MDATHRRSNACTLLTKANLEELTMADLDIQKSKHFLKSLDEDMAFLSSLMSQVNSLSSQVIFVSSSLRGTWNSLDTIHKNCDKREKEEGKS